MSNDLLVKGRHLSKTKQIIMILRSLKSARNYNYKLFVLNQRH